MSVRKFTLAEISSVLVRRRWLVLVPFAVGVAVTPLLAKYAPVRYRSEAVIVVTPQQVPENFVQPTVSMSVEERLPALSEQILSRHRLELIITEMDLYKRERARSVMEDVVQVMRADIRTTPVSGGKNLDAFRVSYISDDPETARKVTEKLSTLYIDQNTLDRTTQADHTSEFLAATLEDAKRRLLEQEQKLENYKKKFAGQMPSQLTGNLQAIQNAAQQLQTVNESIHRAQERRLFLERQFADAQAVPAPAVQVTSPSEPTTTAQALEMARARRAILLQRFTPDYPDVVTLDRTIADLSARLELEIPVTSAGAPVSAAEAAQQRRMRELQAELAALDRQLETSKAETARLKKVIDEYQAKIDALPTRESELVELTRDYGTLQATYDSLRRKSEDSVIAGNLERRRIGEQFRLVDEASRPGRPYNQRARLTIMASGAVGGLVLGLMLVGLVELRDTSYKSAEEVLQALSVPVLASIPVMTSERERRAAKWRSWAMDICGTALLLAAVAALAFWRVRL